MGESLRGNVNLAVDSAFGDKQGEAKNQGVVNKGEAEIRRGLDTVAK